jgi:prolyl oligopeptidase
MFRTRNVPLGLCAVVVLGVLAKMGEATATGGEKPEYPTASKSDHVDSYHGTKVPDPYRWMENLDASETTTWVKAEAKLTESFLARIPARRPLKSRLTQLWDYEKFGIPSKEGGRYFWSRNSGLQNQSVIFTALALDAEPAVLLDPNTFSADGTIALTGLEPSPDGQLVAYGKAVAGSDWQEWFVRDIAAGNDRPDKIEWVKFSSVSWTKDGAGFFYGRFPEPKPGENLKAANYHQRLYYHKLGTPQSEDQLVIEDPEHKEWQFHGSVTDDGRYLVITVSKGTDDKYRILWKDLNDPANTIRTLIDHFYHEYSFIDNEGTKFYFKTDAQAPRGRVIAIDLALDDPVKQQIDIIPQAEETLGGVSRVGDVLFAAYLKDAHSLVKVFDLAGRPVRDVALPGLGTASGFGGERGDRETFYSYTSFTQPATIYRHDLATGTSSVLKSPKLGFNPADYETKQVFYASKDGTKIPMFLSYKKTTRLGPETPCYLYGYGGFNVSLTPSFSPSNLVWMERGGVHAVANLRGGGEYGESWHKSGTKAKKQNVFDDFIAAAEYLIREKVTSTPKLAIEGRSNGGLLIGAVLNQRPELFGAAVPGVGVMDMLRFHKFTIGYAWVDDYGSSDNSDDFAALRAYSPLHNIKQGACYPPTLVITADHDDRVYPAHSFKYAAALQAAQGCDNPILIRIETRAGHGAGKPTSKLIEEAADKWAFLVHSLGIGAEAASGTNSAR